MQLIDLLKLTCRSVVLDISAMDNEGKTIKCFACKANKVPKKYLNWYIGYVCPEKTEWSYCAKNFKTENIHACLLLDIYKQQPVNTVANKEEIKKE